MKTSYVIIIVMVIAVIAIFMLMSSSNKSQPTLTTSVSQQTNPLTTISNTVNSGLSIVSSIGSLFKKKTTTVDNTDYMAEQGWF